MTSLQNKIMCRISHSQNEARKEMRAECLKTVSFPTFLHGSETYHLAERQNIYKNRPRFLPIRQKGE